MKIFLINKAYSHSGTRVMSTNIGPEKMHTVYLGYHKRFVWLVTDGYRKEVGFTSIQHQYLDTEPYLYVGGTKPNMLKGFTYFEGKSRLKNSNE
jgi:laminin G domain